MDLGAQVIDFFSYVFGNILLAPPEKFLIEFVSDGTWLGGERC